MSDLTLPHDENDEVAVKVREALARRRITRQFLADQAMISLSTLEKALSGKRPFTLASVVRLEAALGLTLRRNNRAESLTEARPSGIAPAELGSYSRPAVSWIEGGYLTVRPSFSNPESIYTYRTEIAWSGDKGHLIFTESERMDAAYTQDGSVSIPHQSGHIYLVTNKLGQYRLIVISRPTIAGEMFGILTTLQSGRGTHLLPVSTPIVLVPLKSLGGEAKFGRVENDDGPYPRYRALLRRAVEEPFALLIAK